MKIFNGITYIVTVFNKESFIKSTLLAIIPYLGKNEQLLVVNDGSTDKSLNVINQILNNEATRDSKVITQKNTGPSLAINRSLKYVKYSHIKFVDGDDILAPNIAKLMKGEMERCNLDLLYGDWAWSDNPNNYSFSNKILKSKIQESFFTKIIQKGWGGSSNLMVKTKTLVEVGGCDPQIFVQDYSIPLRISGAFLKDNKQKFLIGITQTVICCAPKNIKNRIMTNKAQTLYDLSIAALNFIDEHSQLDISLKQKVLRNILRRCWRWKKRQLDTSFFSISFLKFLATYSFFNKYSTGYVRKEVNFTWDNDKELRKIYKVDNSKKKILIYVGLDLLGDALIKLPFLLSIRKKFPNAEITWLAGKGKTLFNSSLKPLTTKLIDRIFENYKYGESILELFGKSKLKENFDIVIDTQKRLLTTLILKKIPCETFISPCSKFVFSDLKKKISNVNLAYQLLELTQLLGAETKNLVYEPPPNPKLSKQVSLYYRKISFKKAAICAGASIKKKCWPLDSYIELSKKLYEKKIVPVFFLGPNEINLYGYIKSKLPFAMFPLQSQLLNKVGPEDTIFFAKECDLGVSNDTGCGHLLATSNIPLITLFGPTSSRKFKPYSYKQNIVIDAKKQKIENISVDDVLNAVKKLKF